jgi:hypothetical protein
LPPPQLFIYLWKMYVKCFLFASVLAIPFLISCDNKATKQAQAQDAAIANSEAAFRTFKWRNLFSIQIPDYMEATTELNQGAAAQFMNPEREAYMIVIFEEKSVYSKTGLGSKQEYKDKSPLEIFTEMQVSSLEEFLKEKRRSDKLEYLTMNGMNAARTVLEGRPGEGGLMIHYQLATYEGKEVLYFVLTWTLFDASEAMNFMKMNASDLKIVSESLREQE